jgi:hypothetical protein
MDTDPLQAAVIKKKLKQNEKKRVRFNSDE